MIQKKQNIRKVKTKQLFAVVFTLFLLLSSCSTKRGIKTLLNIPVSSTKVIDYKENNKLTSLSNNCLSCEDLQVLTVDFSDSSLLKSLYSAILQSAVYTGFLYNDFVDEPVRHTYSPPNILGEVPFYILFKKLILHSN